MAEVKIVRGFVGESANDAIEVRLQDLLTMGYVIAGIVATQSSPGPMRVCWTLIR